jgi:predicted  nucleic acid-binding Zn-ribbon protein
MATTEDPIANLQRFIASLTMSNGAVEKITQHVQETSQVLTQLEGEAHDHGGGLKEHLEEFRSKLDAAEDEVRQAVEDVRHAAADGQQALTEAGGYVEKAGGDVEETAHNVSAHLDDEHSRLTDQGFAVLGHTLDEAEQQLESERQEAEHAFKELEGAVHGFETEAQTTWEAGHGAFDHATSDLSQEESALAAEASGAHQAFDSAASEIEGVSHSLEGEIGTIYDAFTAGVDAAGGELEGAAQNLFQQAVGFVEAGGQAKVEEPATALDADALGPLGEEYAALAVALHSAAATTAELEPLADDLVRSKAVVGQIDKLVNAVQE